MRVPGFRNGVSGCYVSRAVVHSILPLAVLEAVRNLDTPVEDGLAEFADELLVKRLGLSSTVAMQLAQYETLVRRDARAVLGGDLHREQQVPVALVRDTLAVSATPDGAACGVYGAAFAELLRLLVGFEGAMLHTSCRATGGAQCEWRAAPPDP